MSRIAWVLVVLLSVLLIVGWWFLLWSPTSDEIEQVRAEVETTEQQTEQQRRRAAELRDVRERTPELEAAIVATRTLIPESADLPGLLRQLQLAADQSGVRVVSITPGQPSPIDVGGPEVSSIGLSLALQGTYFQVVDFVRRLEDPAVVGRGVRWSSAGVAIGGEYPELSVSLSAELFSQSPAAPVADAPETQPDGEAGEPEDGDPGSEDEELELEAVGP